MNIWLMQVKDEVGPADFIYNQQAIWAHVEKAFLAIS